MLIALLNKPSGHGRVRGMQRRFSLVQNCSLGAFGLGSVNLRVQGGPPGCGLGMREAHVARGMYLPDLVLFSPAVVPRLKGVARRPVVVIRSIEHLLLHPIGIALRKLIEGIMTPGCPGLLRPVDVRSELVAAVGVGIKCRLRLGVSKKAWHSR